MADAAVSFAVETLGNLLIEKAVFLNGVKGEVEWVRDELKRMKCFLADASKKQSDSDSIRNWISDIRKAAHDAEDAIEMFVLNVESKGLKERCIRFPKYMYHLNKVGKEIQSLRKWLAAIKDSRLRYGIEGAESSTMTISQLEVENRRRLAYWQNDKHLVGMEKDVEILLGEAVFEKSKGLSVAAVLGMGGIGKSTLARKIYNHPEVVRGFEFRAWVVVSSEFTAEDIMKQILQQLGVSFDELRLVESVGDDRRRQEDLKKELHQRLAGKRYFIVLDDVWEAAHWEYLSTAFPDGGEVRIYEDIIVIARGGFPKLEVLCLQDIKQLYKYEQVAWRMEIDESAMPELNRFIIRKCKNSDFENLPERIKSAIVQAH